MLSTDEQSPIAPDTGFLAGYLGRQQWRNQDTAHRPAVRPMTLGDGQRDAIHLNFNGAPAGNGYLSESFVAPPGKTVMTIFLDAQFPGGSKLYIEQLQADGSAMSPANNAVLQTGTALKTFGFPMPVVPGTTYRVRLGCNVAGAGVTNQQAYISRVRLIPTSGVGGDFFDQPFNRLASDPGTKWGTLQGVALPYAAHGQVYSSAMAREYFDTTATEFGIEFLTTYTPGLGQLMDLALFVDGEFDRLITTNTNAQNRLGLVAVSGLKPGRKRIELRASGQYAVTPGHPDSGNYAGTFIRAVYFPQTAYARRFLPVAAPRTICVLGDSISQGELAAGAYAVPEPHRQAWPMLVLASGIGDVILQAGGSGALHDYIGTAGASDATKIAALVTRLVRAGVTDLVIEVALADQLNNLWPNVAAFTTAMAALLDACNGVIARVFVQTPIPASTASEAATNVAGETIAAWRTAIAAVVASRTTFATLVPGTVGFAAYGAANYGTDPFHPNENGQALLGVGYLGTSYLGSELGVSPGPAAPALPTSPNFTKVGVGQTPVELVDAIGTVGGGDSERIKVRNLSPKGSASLQASNDLDRAVQFVKFGSTFDAFVTLTGGPVPGNSYIYDSTGSIVIASENQDLYFCCGGALRFRIQSNGNLGFHGANPVPKAAAPVTLADVITILQNLGLCS